MRGAIRRASQKKSCAKFAQVMLAEGLRSQGNSERKRQKLLNWRVCLYTLLCIFFVLGLPFEYKVKAREGKVRP